MPAEIRKCLRFSAPDWAEVEAKLSEHSITFSVFARAAILEKKIVTNLNRDLIHQVQRVGNNLNQIAKALNQKSSDLPNSEVLKILLELKKSVDRISHDR